MPSRVVTVLCLAALMTVAPGAARAQLQKEPTMPQAPTVIGADIVFVTELGQDALLALELARMAASRATDQAARRHAERVVTDYARIRDTLGGLVRSRALPIPVPSALDRSRRREVARLAKLEGRAFDAAYRERMAKLTADDVRHCAGEWNDGAQPALRTFAAQTLPVVQGLASDTFASQH